MTDPVRRSLPEFAVDRGGVRFPTGEELESLRWAPRLPPPPPEPPCPNGCCRHDAVEHAEHPDDDGTMVCSCYGCPCAPGMLILDPPAAGMRWDVRQVPA